MRYRFSGIIFLGLIFIYFFFCLSVYGNNNFQWENLQENNLQENNENKPFDELTSILVTSEPSDAKVYLDHKYKGETPLTVYGLWPGEHLVRIVAEPDYLIFQNVIDTRGRQPAQLHAVLIPTTMTYFKRGLAFFRTGDLTGAKEAFEMALQPKPKKIADALFYLGVIAKKEGDLVLGVELLRQHAFYRPDAFRTHLLLGELHEELGRINKAATSYKLAALLVPGLNISLDQFKIATWDRIQFLEKRLKKDPYNSFLELNLAYYYEQKGRLHEALKHYKVIAKRHEAWLEKD